MILQKDLQLFRFQNIRPHPEFSPAKFEYQLFNKSDLLGVEYSDNEFRSGLVTIMSPKKARIELINSTQDIDAVDLEDINTYLIPVKAKK